VQVGFRLHEDGGWVELDAKAVFSKFPGWSGLEESLAQQCLDSIPKLVSVAAKRGYLVEKDFESAGFWQDQPEKEEEEKKSRDDQPLHRQRAVILTTKGSRERIKRKKEEKEEKEEKMAGKKAKAEAKALYKKQVDDAFHALTRDANTGGIVLPKKKWQEEGECGNCFAWWGAWQERGLLDDGGFRWKACDFCDT